MFIFFISFVKDVTDIGIIVESLFLFLFIFNFFILSKNDFGKNGLSYLSIESLFTCFFILSLSFIFIAIALFFQK